MDHLLSEDVFTKKVELLARLAKTSGQLTEDEIEKIVEELLEAYSWALTLAWS